MAKRKPIILNVLAWLILLCSAHSNITHLVHQTTDYTKEKKKNRKIISPR